MLELAGDLRLLHEPAEQVGLVFVRFEQDLDGQVATKVGISTLEYSTHAAAGDLAQELEVDGVARCGRYPGRTQSHAQIGLVIAFAGRRPAVEKSDPGNRAAGRCQRLQNRSEAGRLGRRSVARGAIGLHRVPEHAARTEAPRGVGGPLGAARRAADGIGVDHDGPSLGLEIEFGLASEPLGPARPLPLSKTDPEKGHRDNSGNRPFRSTQGVEQGADLVVDLGRVVHRRGDLLAEQGFIALP